LAALNRLSRITPRDREPGHGIRCLCAPGRPDTICANERLIPTEPIRRAAGRRRARAIRPAAGRLAAQVAPLLRPHDRLDHRRRGRRAGCPHQGDRGLRAGETDRQCRGLAVPHCAQCCARFSAQARASAGDAQRGGPRYGRRSGFSRERAAGGGCQPAHLHAATGVAAKQRDSDGRARLFPRRGRRHHRYERAGGEGAPASRAGTVARARAGARRFTGADTGGGRARASPAMSRVSMRATSMPCATCSATTCAWNSSTRLG
jgi:hypothetical protein